MFDKKARVGTVLLFFLTLVLLSFVANAATGSNETLGVEPVLNETLEGMLFNDTNTTNESGSSFENSSNETQGNISENNPSEEISNETSFEETTTHVGFHLQDLDENELSYEEELFENERVIYPNLVFDDLSLIDAQGVLILDEFSQVEDQSYSFISTYLLDASELSYSSGTFSKKVEGEEIYKCYLWTGTSCDEPWMFVERLKGDTFVQAIEGTQVVYAETRPQSFGISEIIVQDEINSSQADGMLVYEALNDQTPNYRLWDETNTFGSQLDASSVSGDITWIVTKGSHQRDEMIMVAMDKNLDINTQVYSGSWGNLLELTTAAEDALYRGFDVAYEDLSGDALIVYENDASIGNNDFAYQIWDGSSYSGETTVDTGLTNAATRWLKLIPRKGTDQIMALAHNSAGELRAMLWNGTDFDTNFAITASTATTSSTEEHFAFAWEDLSGQGLLVYGETDLTYRTYDSVGGFGGTENTVSTGAIDGIRLCSQENSDYIGLIWQDSGNDVEVSMWGGSSILASPPSADTQTEANGENNLNVDCTFYNATHALFGYTDNNGLALDYFTFNTATNSWSTGGLTSVSSTTNFASDDIKGLRFVQHPTTAEVMIVAQDIAEAVTGILWDGANFQTIAQSPYQGSTEVANGASESASFDWYRYDPNPLVSGILPSGASYTPSSTVIINVSVTDNIAVDAVVANITLPDESVQQITLSSANGTLFNGTFSGTTLAGTYTIQIVANDTSVHQNYNSTETSTFTVSDSSFPLVFELLPSVNTQYNVSDSIEIAANASDSLAIAEVYVNITYPNSTLETYQLSNSTGNDQKYNTSFTAPVLLGTYNLTFIANDSSGNINSSETSNFTVIDSIAPSVSSLLPLESSAYNEGATITVSALVTDSYSDVAVVSANIAYPNGTIDTLALSDAGSNIYLNTFTAPSLIGDYNVTYIANDTYSNTNATTTTNFTVTDASAPSLTAFACEPGPANIDQAVHCNATITDTIAVSSVAANVTLPNGTIEVQSVASNDSTYNFTFSTTDQVGSFTVSWIATDSSSNANTTTTSFTVQDVVIPSVTTLAPTVNSVYNVSNSINLSADVSDDVSVSSVFANISFPNGTLETYTLSFDAGSSYNSTFTAPALLGTYTVTFIANDSSNNINSTETSNFTINDVVVPSVSSLLPESNSVYNITNLIELAATVSDDVSLSTVVATVSFPNGTAENYSLSLASGSKYNSSFTAPALLGDYNVSIFANDSSNNINSTEQSNFTVNDIVNPQVTINLPLPGTTISTGDSISLSITATDDVNISTVLANVSMPNGTIEQSTLSRSGNTYTGSFTRTQSSGSYNLTIIANDTSNNINNTEQRSFTTSDGAAPIVTLVRPSINHLNASSSIDFVCNATDNIGLVNTSLYLNTSGSFTLNATESISGTSNESTFSVTNIPEGNYIWNCLVTDSDNNEAFAAENFTITIDQSAPSVSLVVPQASSEYNISSTVNLTATITDVSSISSATVNISYPNGTLEQYSLTQYTSGEYATTFTAPSLIGNYNVTFSAADAASNTNATTTTNFTVTDASAPSLTAFACEPDPANIDQAVHCNATITDTIAVSSVAANVTLPNGTVEVQSVADNASSYNFTFTTTDQVGTFTVSWLATDSSNNANSTTSTFTVQDVVIPSVTNLAPALNSAYNVSNSINLSADVSDDVSVSTVLANISYPNGTLETYTLSFDAGSSYNSTFTAPALLGTYNVTFIANDSSNNINSTETSNFTVNDITAPTVSDLLPENDSVYNITNTIELAATVSDDVSLSTVVATVFFPNGTTENYSLSLASGSKYNSSFTAPALIGAYNVSIFANDTSNNINSAEQSNFTINDVLSPVISSLGCDPQTLNLSESTLCNVSSSDSIAIDTLTAMVIFPSGAEQSVSVSNTSDNYNFTFTNTTQVGVYTVNWTVNDSSGNENNTTSNFTVTDYLAPVVTLSAPANNSNFSSTSIAFNFTVSDNYYSNSSCSLFIDATSTQTNSTSINGTLTNLEATALVEGSHEWYVNCTDPSGLSNISETRSFIADTSYVTFISLTTSPSSEDDLDPGTVISVNANVTDNLTSVDTVILQYKLENESTYTNATMVLNATGGYNYSLTLNQNGTYNLRLAANDTVGNSDNSSNINITLQYEYSWSRSPAVFNAISTNSSLNVSVGTLVINNTGDFALYYNLSSDSNTTVYNETENFSLESGGVKYLSINETAPSAGVKAITYTLITNESSADPQNATTTVSIAVAPGQPILNLAFSTPATETKTVTQGDTGVAFEASIENLGEGNASNITLTFDFEDAWNVSFGSVNNTLSELLSGDSEQFSVEVDIPSDAPAGTFTVTVNATGVNDTGSDIGSLGYVFPDTVEIIVQELVSITGSTGSIVTGGGSGSSSSSSGSSGGGGGGGGSSSVEKTSYEGRTEVLETTELFSILRGEGESTPISIANVYSNSVMKNIELQVFGFFAQYVVVSPPILESSMQELTLSREAVSFDLTRAGKHSLTLLEKEGTRARLVVQSDPIEFSIQEKSWRYLDLDGDRLADIGLYYQDAETNTYKIYETLELSEISIGHKEALDFAIDIFAPTYLVQQDYNISLRILADIIPLNVEEAGFTVLEMTEFRDLIFRVHDASEGELSLQMQTAREQILEMLDAGFYAKDVEGLFAQAESKLAGEEYKETQDLLNQIAKIHGMAFEAFDIIQELQLGMQEASEQWLATPETRNSLDLALVAFERGDYVTALERAKNAQFVFVLETRGRVNLVWFVINYWWQVVLASVLSLILVYLIYRRIRITIISQRVRNLSKEEETIHKLMKETQDAYLVKGTISAQQFERYNESYEKRLSKVKQLRVKLRNRRVALLSTKVELATIRKEKKEINELMKKDQAAYLLKGKISRSKFMSKAESNRARLAEIEQEESLVEARLRKEKSKGKVRDAAQGFVDIFSKREKKDQVKKKKKQKKAKAEKVSSAKKKVKGKKKR